MRMKKIMMTIIVFALAVTVFAAGVREDDPRVELTAGSINAVGTAGARTVDYIAEYLSERSGGNIVLKHFPAGQLGQPPDMIDQCSIGALDVVWVDISNYGPIDKDYNIFGMGYVFRDQDHLARFLESPDYERMAEQLRVQKGVLTISSGAQRPARHVFSKKPIRSAEDFAGMNFRVPGLEMYLRTFEGIGANPMRIDYGESYMALSQGLVDGIENPLDAGYGMKFHQVAPYFVPTGHIRTVNTFVMNEDRFNSLPADYQELIREAARAGDEFYMQLVEQEKEELLRAMEQEGATILPAIDVVPLQRRLASVARDLEAQGAWTEGLWERIQAVE
ncbi:MAG: TRAP transporter substrate-binding protein [Spirochaetaceae bacterium]|nr:MAG: TRAP transporter substrate-binding protein [Spirochaetaceae bacterium]